MEELNYNKSARRQLQKKIVQNELVEGKSTNEIFKAHSEEFGLGQTALYKIIKEAIDELYSEDYVNTLRAINTMRLENLYQKALEQGDLKTAIRAIEVQIKVYDNKPAVQIGVNNADTLDVNFNF